MRFAFAAFPRRTRSGRSCILTRGSAIRYLTRVTVAPITSTVRGVPSEVALGIEDGMRQSCAVNLHNVLTVQQENLGRRLTQLEFALAACARSAPPSVSALGCDAGFT